MTMKLLTAVSLLLLLFVNASHAQERGYAGPAELKGLRRIYVQAEGSHLVRIMEKLRKSQTGVEVVDAPGEAELILSFWAEKFADAFLKEYRRANGLK